MPDWIIGLLTLIVIAAVPLFVTVMHREAMRPQMLPTMPTVHEVLQRALELRNEAFRATPVNDETRDAHFALEHLRQLLTDALRSAS